MVRTTVQALVLAAIFYIAMIKSCQAEDFLLYLSNPVPEDQTLMVATYFRNQKEAFYFTIVYKHTSICQKFSTQIRFTPEAARYQHRVSEKWINYTFHACVLDQIPIPVEQKTIVDFNPPPFYKDEEVYIIYPNRVN